MRLAHGCDGAWAQRKLNVTLDAFNLLRLDLNLSLQLNEILNVTLLDDYNPPPVNFPSREENDKGARLRAGRRWRPLQAPDSHPRAAFLDQQRAVLKQPDTSATISTANSSRSSIVARLSQTEVAWLPAGLATRAASHTPHCAPPCLQIFLSNISFTPLLLEGAVRVGPLMDSVANIFLFFTIADILARAGAALQGGEVVGVTRCFCACLRSSACCARCKCFCTTGPTRAWVCPRLTFARAKPTPRHAPRVLDGDRETLGSFGRSVGWLTTRACRVSLQKESVAVVGAQVATNRCERAICAGGPGPALSHARRGLWIPILVIVAGVGLASMVNLYYPIYRSYQVNAPAEALVSGSQNGALRGGAGGVHQHASRHHADQQHYGGGVQLRRQPRGYDYQRSRQGQRAQVSRLTRLGARSRQAWR
jgi:hypothetical protein